MSDLEHLEEMGRINDLIVSRNETLWPIVSEEREVHVRECVKDHVLHHPLARDYMRLVFSTHTCERDLRLTEPWMAIGERLNAALVLATANTGATASGQEITANVESRVALTFALWALRATPYLWSQEIWNIAGAAPLPKHTISSDVLAQSLMFWSLETSIENGEKSTNWMLIKNLPEGMLLVQDVTNLTQGTVRISARTLRYRVVWPTGVPEEDQLHVGALLKACSFLASPLVTEGGTRLPRAERRRLERAGRPAADREALINVVQLRHIMRSSSSHHEGNGVERDHQWWVSGHFRAQWYPSLQAHRVIWIAPHLKGPSDKPLIDKIYAVTR